VQWYKVLDKVKIPGRPNAELLARVAADQLIFTPINLTCFFTGMSVLEGSSPKEKLQNNYQTALLKNWTVWPAVQLVNFKVVPLEHRLLVVNLVSLGMCISNKNSSSMWIGAVLYMITSDIVLHRLEFIPELS